MTSSNGLEKPLGGLAVCVRRRGRRWRVERGVWFGGGEVANAGAAVLRSASSVVLGDQWGNFL